MVDREKQLAQTPSNINARPGIQLPQRLLVMDRQHFIYTAWDASQQQHPGNRPDDFIVELPQTVPLPGHWKCGLLEVKYSTHFNEPSDTETIYICCDICDESIVLGARLPVVRSCSISASLTTVHNLFNNIYYVRTIQEELSSFRIYILDQNLNSVSFKGKTFSCVLHLTKDNDASTKHD